ncbi:MAG TPA: CDP-alcohol phosphatidyltransferase family protein [Polyangiaceae bacterium]
MLDVVHEQPPKGLSSPDLSVFEEARRITESRLGTTVWKRLFIAHYIYRGSVLLGLSLARLGVTPNALTYTSLALAAGAGLAIATGHFAAAALVIITSGICDILDGVVARASGRISRYGALLDSSVDRLSDGLPLLGMIVIYSRPTGGNATAVAAQTWFAVIPAAAMLAGLAVSYVRARAESLGASLPPLFMRRSERLVLLVLSLLFAPISLGIDVPSPILLFGVSVLGVLSIVGTVFALRAARIELDAVGE